MIGTKFSETQNGYTVTGWGRVTREYEIVEKIGENLFSCKLTRDDAVMSINPDYRVQFKLEEINRLISKL